MTISLISRSNLLEDQLEDSRFSNIQAIAFLGNRILELFEFERKRQNWLHQ